ncbi:unnamed protein product [Phaeothamnion confervicola]
MATSTAPRRVFAHYVLGRLAALFFLCNPGSAACFADSKTYLQERFPNRDLVVDELQPEAWRLSSRRLKDLPVAVAGQTSFSPSLRRCLKVAAADGCSAAAIAVVEAPAGAHATEAACAQSQGVSKAALSPRRGRVSLGCIGAGAAPALAFIRPSSPTRRGQRAADLSARWTGGSGGYPVGRGGDSRETVSSGGGGGLHTRAMFRSRRRPVPSSSSSPPSMLLGWGSKPAANANDFYGSDAAAAAGIGSGGTSSTTATAASATADLGYSSSSRGGSSGLAINGNGSGASLGNSHIFTVLVTGAADVYDSAVSCVGWYLVTSDIGRRYLHPPRRGEPAFTVPASAARMDGAGGATGVTAIGGRYDLVGFMEIDSLESERRGAAGNIGW